MKDLEYIQKLASYYGKGYDHVMLREDNIAYVFNMESMPSVPATVHEDCIDGTVMELAGFGKLVRIISCVDSSGRYVLPDIDELEAAAMEDY